ncbi:MAG: DMT family transporter [Bacteroidia bacterium]|nr:DMT family transporter [Bacteroidia bacterium]
MRERAFLAILTSATMAGASGVFIKNIHVAATSMSFMRAIFPTVIVGAIMMSRKQPIFRGNYPFMIGVSVLNTLRSYLFFTAFIYTSMANVVLISYTWPIFVALIGSIYLKEKITRRELAVMMMAFSGILFVYLDKPFSFANRDFLGMTAALFTALIHATSIVIFKKVSNFYSRTEIIFYQNMAGVVIFLPFILINRPVPDGSDVLFASGHAILLGTLGAYLFFFGLKHLKAGTASALSYVEILSALLLSVFLMKETITWNMGVGGAMIVLATVLLRKA